MVLKLSKIASFLQFLLRSAKKSEAVIAISVYAYESCHLALLENVIGYYAITSGLEDLSV